MEARSLIAIASFTRTESAEVLRSLWDDIGVELEDHPCWRAYIGNIRKKEENDIGRIFGLPSLTVISK